MPAELNGLKVNGTLTWHRLHMHKQAISLYRSLSLKLSEAFPQHSDPL